MSERSDADLIRELRSESIAWQQDPDGTEMVLLLRAASDRLETLERENARLQEVASRVMASEEYCVNRQRLGKDCGECLYCTARKALEKP